MTYVGYFEAVLPFLEGRQTVRRALKTIKKVGLHLWISTYQQYPRHVDSATRIRHIVYTITECPLAQYL